MIETIKSLLQEPGWMGFLYQMIGVVLLAIPTYAVVWGTLSGIERLLNPKVEVEAPKHEAPIRLWHAKPLKGTERGTWVPVDLKFEGGLNDSFRKHFATTGFKPPASKPSYQKFADKLHPPRKTPAADAYRDCPEDPWKGWSERLVVNHLGMTKEQERRWEDHKLLRRRLYDAWCQEQREAHFRTKQSLKHSASIIKGA